MSLRTRSLFDGLRHQTTDLLSSQGDELKANQIFHCVMGSRCNRCYCPQCAWVRALDRSNHAKQSVLRAANDFEAATGHQLSIFSFTMTAPDIPVMALRETADRMALKLSKLVSKRPRTILGSACFFEGALAQVRGAVTDLVYPHWHGLIGVADPDSLALRAFGNMPHIEQVDLKRGIGWIDYSNKAKPAQFVSHWKGLLAQPETFLQRIEQMKNFQPGRYSGLFRRARAA
jgi:hypothetical protein